MEETIGHKYVWFTVLLGCNHELLGGAAGEVENCGRVGELRIVKEYIGWLDCCFVF